MLFIIAIFLDMTAPPIFSNICGLSIIQTLYWAIFYIDTTLSNFFIDVAQLLF